MDQNFIPNVEGNSVGLCCFGVKTDDRLNSVYANSQKPLWRQNYD